MQLSRVIVSLLLAAPCGLVTESASAAVGACVAFQSDPENAALNKACQTALIDLKKARAALQAAEALAFNGGEAFAQPNIGVGGPQPAPPAQVVASPADTVKTTKIETIEIKDIKAGTTTTTTTVTGTDPTDVATAVATGAVTKQKFGGLEFGVGIGFTYDLGNRDRIKGAELVNGIVRATQTDNARARLLFESHYFFLPNSKFLTLEAGDWGLGPFVAFQGGSDNVVQGFGGGIMLGLKRLKTGTGTPFAKAAAAADASSFNIGLGGFYDFDVQTLGDGLRVNQPLPAGETAVRFTKRSQFGLLLLTSFSF